MEMRRLAGGLDLVQGEGVEHVLISGEGQGAVRAGGYRADDHRAADGLGVALRLPPAVVAGRVGRRRGLVGREVAGCLRIADVLRLAEVDPSSRVVDALRNGVKRVVGVEGHGRLAWPSPWVRVRVLGSWSMNTPSEVQNLSRSLNATSPLAT